MPVPGGWHKAYVRGDADTSAFQDYVLDLSATGEDGIDDQAEGLG
jgi:hypothetical protein